MIVTKSWLSDWLDLDDKNLQDLTNALNSIGIEVDKALKFKVPDGIVVGFVKEKIKHENSDKLSICQVDIGSQVLQIVCGASNVDKDQFVAVATNGTVMPNGMEIKQAKLRGVESYGMLCSSSELGFNKTNEGILILDKSIGELELGKPLNHYAIFNDDFIEVELTPNRGDCLSIYGIARDLSTVLNLNLKELPIFKEGENVLGIGRVLRLTAQKELNSLFNYRVIEIKESISTNCLMKLRLAQIENLKDNAVENLLNYTMHSTGVLFNAYDFNKLSKNNEEIILNLNKKDSGETAVVFQEEILAVSGIYQNELYKCDENSKIIILEANYTDPLIIAEVKNFYKKQDEKIFYKSFRGTEPKLNIGMDYLLINLEKDPNITIYSSSQQVLQYKENPNIAVNLEGINNIIGQEVDKDEVLKILKKLGFEIILSGDNLINVKAPLHRPDIKNLADICEEVLRIVGIDNIESKAMDFVEKNRINKTYIQYKELLNLRNKAINNGYFESLHYVLDNTEELKDFSFKEAHLKLLNPITAELNTLRTTLLNHLLNAASFNYKNSKKIIKLFECGAVFNAHNEELNHMALIHSGYKEEAGIINKAKPEMVDFYSFLLDVKNIIGNFKLKKSNYSFLSPYEQAEIVVNNQIIGFIGRVHLKLENKRDLLKTYVCEFDLNLLKNKFKTARNYSKFPGVSRDLSIIVPKNYEYELIKNAIEELNINNLENFKLIDLYHDESLGEYYSLTINFNFKDYNKTLEEGEISNYMEQILLKLEELGLKLR